MNPPIIKQVIKTEEAKQIFRYNIRAFMGMGPAATLPTLTTDISIPDTTFPASVNTIYYNTRFIYSIKKLINPIQMLEINNNQPNHCLQNHYQLNHSTQSLCLLATLHPMKQNNSLV
mgnify:FL=1